MSEQEQRTETKKKETAKATSGELITVNVKLSQPFVDFMKEYLRYFGSKETLEDLCREIIYDKIGQLYDDLHAFAGTRGHLLETKNWYWKNSRVSLVSIEAEETETEG
jgi:hypothetical protein